MNSCGNETHRSTEAAALIQDLLSFDSWEFYKDTTPSLEGVTEATSVATSIAGDGADNLLQWSTEATKRSSKECAKPKTISTVDEEYAVTGHQELTSSSEDSSETCDTSAAVHAATLEDNIYAAAGKKECSSNNNNNKTGNGMSVQVSISGVIFPITETTVPHLCHLPWTLVDAPKRETSETNDGTPTKNASKEATMIPHLQTSPVLFELLLNNVMYGIVPNLKGLTKADVEELEPLAILLELVVLTSAIEQRLRNRGGAGNRRKSSSFSKRKAKSGERKGEGITQEKSMGGQKSHALIQSSCTNSMSKTMGRPSSTKRSDSMGSNSNCQTEHDDDDDDDEFEPQYEEGGNMLLETFTAIPNEIVAVFRKWQTSWVHRKLTKQAAIDTESAIS